MLRGTFAAYLMGVLWFAGNCYWIYQTMFYYGGLPPLHFGRHPDCLQPGTGALLRRLRPPAYRYRKAFRSPATHCSPRPFFWVALELLSARFTKVPWDLAGLFANR